MARVRELTGVMHRLRFSPRALYATARGAARFTFIPGTLALIVAGYAACSGSAHAAVVFGITAAGCLALAGVAHWVLPNAPARFRRPAATISLAWALIALVGAVPMLWLGGPDSQPCSLARWPNAVFESFSAFTSTGLSVTCDASRLPPSLQLWRSMAQWVGGMGMAVFALMVLDVRRTGREQVTEELSEHALGDDLKRSLRAIALIYGGLTAATTGAFLSVGMPPWEAVNHGLTAVSTGGMTVTSDSFASYGASAKIVAMTAMVAGGASFGVYLALRGEHGLRRVWASSQLRAYVGVLMIGTPVLGWLSHVLAADASWLDAAFEWTSAATTCGFTVVKLGQWPARMWIPLIAMMVVGACAGSTSGGVKLSRAIWLLEQLARRIRRQLEAPATDHEEPPFRFDGDMVEPHEARSRSIEAGVLLWVWLLTLTLGVVILAVLEPAAPLGALVFDATSALGGVGLSAGFVGADLSTASKLAMCSMMWLGRLEIVSVLAVVVAPFVEPQEHRASR